MELRGRIYQSNICLRGKRAAQLVCVEGHPEECPVDSLQGKRSMERAVRTLKNPLLLFQHGFGKAVKRSETGTVGYADHQNDECSESLVSVLLMPFCFLPHRLKRKRKNGVCLLIYQWFFELKNRLVFSVLELNFSTLLKMTEKVFINEDIF